MATLDFIKKLQMFLDELKKPIDHIEYCKKFIPEGGLVLDVGAGRGRFLCGLLSSEIKAHGIEINPAYIVEAEARAKEIGGEVSIVVGRAEALPYPDNNFDFINCAEVTEHVEDPIAVCREIFRVLKSGGKGYISFHNRFGICDRHYHLYFISWMPRSWAEKILSWLGKNKNDGEAGRQKLSTMHYYTFAGAKKLLSDSGFKIQDTREEKIKTIFGEKSAVLLVYKLIAHGFYPNVFHFLVTKR